MILLIEIISIYLIIISTVIFISKKMNLYDIPNNRKLHKNKILNTSGLALYIFIIYLCFKINVPTIISHIFYISSIVILIGLLDDRKNISASIKLFLISLPTIYLMTSGYNVTDLGEYNFGKIPLGQYYLIFTLLSVGLLTNSYNYIDGVDGLLLSIVITNLAYFALLITNEEIQNLFFYISIAIFINLILNFLPSKNPFKMFTGNSGSLFIGFSISFLIISLYKFYNIHPGFLIWACWFPVYDFLYVTFKRIIKRKLFYLADKNHFHHIIFEIFNKSHFKTVICINSMNILILIFGYQICKNYGAMSSLVSFVILFIGFCAIRIVIEKKKYFK